MARDKGNERASQPPRRRAPHHLDVPIKRAPAETAPAGRAMSDHILGSARACFARFSIPKTTVDDIVEEARISRTTFYKHFRGKAQVILELSFQETQNINKQTKAFQSRIKDIESALVESVLFAINLAKKNDVIQFFLGPASDDMVSEILDRSNEIWDLQTEEWADLYKSAQSQGRVRTGVTASQFARWITNVQHILLTRPLLIGNDEEEQRRMLNTFLVPAVFSDTKKR